jgi:CspA family cold shock protein
MDIKGTVRWFNNGLGYGFVLSPQFPGIQIFLHYSQLQMEGFRTIKQDTPVIFEAVEVEGKLQAHNVRAE